MESQWYTIKEMEALTKRTRSTVYRWIDEGRLQTKREGSRVFVRPADGTIDIDSESVTDETSGHMGQLVHRMEQNAEMLSNFMQNAVIRLGELERENGELNTLVDLQTQRIEELEGIIQEVTKGLPFSDRLKLLSGQAAED